MNYFLKPTLSLDGCYLPYLFCQPPWRSKLTKRGVTTRLFVMPFISHGAERRPLSHEQTMEGGALSLAATITIEERSFQTTRESKDGAIFVFRLMSYNTSQNAKQFGRHLDYFCNFFA